MTTSPPVRAAFVASLALITLPAAAAEIDCRPEKMIRIVTRNVSPGLDPNTFAARPKTLYRLGGRYGRLEEEADPERGMRLLTVINEPDVWIANLADRTGRHIVDAGPSLKFHAPILWSEDLPVALRDLEYGCEVAWMKERAPRRPRAETLDGAKVDRYEASTGAYVVTLYVGRSDGRPRALDFKNGTELLFAVRYIAFEDRLEPDLGLFDTPRGVTFTKG